MVDGNSLELNRQKGGFSTPNGNLVIKNVFKGPSILAFGQKQIIKMRQYPCSLVPAI